MKAMKVGAAFCIVLATAAPAAAAPSVETVATALAGTAGKWRGELQYRDYQSDTWRGLPMQVEVAVQPDAVTTIRTAQYDDEPKTGIVTITTVTLIGAVAGTEDYAIFRKQRDTDIGQARIISFEGGADASHWTLVTSERRKDGDQMAEVRETTTRNGTQLTTLKEFNPDDDGKDQWLPRNRTVLIAIGR